MLNLFPILFLLLFVAVLVWPTRKAAQLVGAVQTSYPMAILSIVVGALFYVVVTFGLGFLVAMATKAQPPATLFMFLGVMASAWAYAKLLETSFFGGITIYLIQIICWVAVGGILYLGAMALSPEMIAGGKISGLEDIRTSGLRTASESVCNCGTDQDCLSRNYREMRKIAAKFESAFLLRGERAKVEEYSRRAKLCAMQPASAPAEAAEAATPAVDPAP